MSGYSYAQVARERTKKEHLDRVRSAALDREAAEAEYKIRVVSAAEYGCTVAEIAEAAGRTKQAMRGILHLHG